MSDFQKAQPQPDPVPVHNSVLDTLRPIATRRWLVTFREDTPRSVQAEAIRRGSDGDMTRLGLLDLATGTPFPAGGAIFLEDIGVAVVTPHQGAATFQMATFDESEAVLQRRPEYLLFAMEQPFKDAEDRTWGVGATGAADSPYTGKGIKVAVLDTGIDLNHPDFEGRLRSVKDFTSETGDAYDRLGHGTHCAGTLGGKLKRIDLPRYGVAPDVEFCIAKVLDDSGSGAEGDILRAIAWAIEEKCDVISMSLGRAVQIGEPPDALYERLGSIALDRGSLIVAAAGNDSTRINGFLAPVSSPANAASIMAVGALDQALAVPYFSNGSVNYGGGHVDIAAPGVNVVSAYPLPREYRMSGGTSMACPHVAGVAALWAESDATLRGRALRDQLLSTARKISPPRRDVGAGLVQAPPQENPIGV